MAKTTNQGPTAESVSARYDLPEQIAALQQQVGGLESGAKTDRQAIADAQAKVSTAMERLAALEAKFGAFVLSAPRVEHILTAAEVSQAIKGDGNVQFAVKNQLGFSHGPVQLPHGQRISPKTMLNIVGYVGSGLQLSVAQPL